MSVEGALPGGMAGLRDNASSWAQMASVMAAEGSLTSLKREGEEGFFSTIGLAGSTSSIEAQVGADAMPGGGGSVKFIL